MGEKLLKRCELLKVNTKLGLVFGFGMICTKGGEDYYELGDPSEHFPEAGMLEAALGFMKSDRVMLDDHTGEPIGQIVFGFPLTKDIAESMGIKTEKTGFIIGGKPDSPELLKKFQTGERTECSMGAVYIEVEAIEAAQAPPQAARRSQVFPR